MVGDGAFSHKIDVTFFKEFLIFEVMAISLNGWILPIGGDALGRVCACSLRSRLVSGLMGLFLKLMKSLVNTNNV